MLVYYILVNNSTKYNISNYSNHKEEEISSDFINIGNYTWPFYLHYNNWARYITMNNNINRNIGNLRKVDNLLFTFDIIKKKDK